MNYCSPKPLKVITRSCPTFDCESCLVLRPECDRLINLPCCAKTRPSSRWQCTAFARSFEGLYGNHTISTIPVGEADGPAVFKIAAVWDSDAPVITPHHPISFQMLKLLAIGFCSLLGIQALPTIRDTSAAHNCTSQTDDGPLFVDGTCTDPLYSEPIIDSEDDYSIDDFGIHAVHCHFASDSTAINFTIHLPTPDRFENRFFQLVYPIPVLIIETEELVQFGADSGGYILSVSSLIGYRHEAAAAKFSRQVAAAYYKIDPESINGYIFGGSGGSYQTLGALENTFGVWQGAVPYIQAIPTSNPLAGTSAAFGVLVLGDQQSDVIDALQPGGSDIYASLSGMQIQVYDEMISLGFPPRGYESLNYTFASAGAIGAARAISVVDPTYVDDFWSMDGYLGTEQSDLGDFFRSRRQMGDLDIKDQRYNGSQLLSLTTSAVGPDISSLGSFFSILDGNGTSLSEIIGMLDQPNASFVVTSPIDFVVPEGAKLQYDNSWFLAAHPYHRHQIPRRPDYYPWYQYRAADGAFRYPQRAVEIGPLTSRAVSGGGSQTGKILFPTIMVQSLLDVNAVPWNADWYRKQIVKELGTDQDLFRIYYNDNSDHFPGPDTNNGFAPYIINYNKLLYQALRDVADWAEKGIEPPRNTQYEVKNSQINIPCKASERGGIQPVVHLYANYDERRVEVILNESVPFRAVAEVPTIEGCVVEISWDYEGVGNWEMVVVDKAERYKEVYGSHTYARPGTYFPAIRVGSSRECLLEERYVVPQNLDRVRVIVT